MKISGSLRRSIALVATLLIGLPLVLLVLLWQYQEYLIFMPNINLAEVEHDVPQDPSDLEISFKNIVLPTRDGDRIHGWLMLHKDSKSRPTVVFFHGNAGSIKHRLSFYDLLFKKIGVNVYAPSYRGYGMSTGTPSEQAFSDDAAAILDKLAERNDLATDQLFVFGRSLGGAVALEAARRRPKLVRGIVVENTFLDLPSLARIIYPPLRYISFLELLIRHKFASIEKIRELEQPILFISGDCDELIPRYHMEQLHKAAARSKSRYWLLVGGGQHNDTWVVHQKSYARHIQEFIKNVTSGTAVREHSLSIGKLRKSDPAEHANFISKLLSTATNEATIAGAEAASGGEL